MQHLVNVCCVWGF